ncbi:RluA family pseudouridine synthase [Marinobacterium sp. CAU 1594]|nr:RluA family pseudouridine synthase [Marinobacterium arenosum]
MAIAPNPSVVSMPAEPAGCLTVLDFLVCKFPHIPVELWQQRMAEGKVHWADGTAIGPDSLFAPQQRIFYYREVAQEPQIPFEERILHRDDQLLVACKPHFLPVVPRGIYVQECLLNRLRRRTGIDSLAPIHRIDRETAGLVLFSVDPDSRGLYQRLFADGKVKKGYRAVAKLADGVRAGYRWTVANRMVTGSPRFRMQVVDGEVNARSEIRCVEERDGRGLFELSPLTGKTHQLRVHMSGLGMPLLNERYYPELQPKTPDDYSRPLQLLARNISFVDPLTGQLREYRSERSLAW